MFQSLTRCEEAVVHGVCCSLIRGPSPPMVWIVSFANLYYILKIIDGVILWSLDELNYCCMQFLLK